MSSVVYNTQIIIHYTLQFSLLPLWKQVPSVGPVPELERSVAFAARFGQGGPTEQTVPCGEKELSFHENHSRVCCPEQKSE